MVRFQVGRALVALRARIVLLAAGGRTDGEIAEATGAALNTVKHWRSRLDAEGLKVLADRKKPGCPCRFDRVKGLTAAFKPPPKSMVRPHWTSREWGRRLGISHVQAGEVWQKFCFKPYRPGTLAFPIDPELEAKVVEVVG